MAYFLGRDVEVFITTETSETNMGLGATAADGVVAL